MISNIALAGRVVAAAVTLAIFSQSELQALGNGDASSKQAKPVIENSKVRAATDSLAVRAELVQSISEFHAMWQRVWRESEERRSNEPEARDLLDRRFAYQNCHHGNEELLRRRRMAILPPPPPHERLMARPDTQYQLINSEPSAFAVCPSWPLIAISTYALDESDWRDASILEPLRPNVRSGRAQLIRRLDGAFKQSPSDGWIAGQLIRFQIDQRDFLSAMATASACKSERWWCTALFAFAIAKNGDKASADIKFAEMRAQMPVAKRCEWTSAQRLMSAADSGTYEKADCKTRDAWNETMWWLADPMYRDAGNDRRVEQDARTVEIALRKAATQDERFHWDSASGGDAIEETIQRYGWPTYLGWGLAKLDEGRDTYLARFNSPIAEPYTTFEYGLGRVHLLTSLDVVKHPLASKATDWDLIRETAGGAFDESWWPREHFKPVRRIIQLPEGQTGMFRRQESVLAAAAVTLSHPALQVDSLLIDMMMLTTTSASHVDSIAQHYYVGNETAVLQGIIKSEPALLAIEGKGIGALRIDARTRFAIAPPPTLSQMKKGEIALSEPILIKAESAANTAILGDSLIGDMLGSTQLDAKHRQVGVFWETYGVALGDTVRVSVRIESNNDVGAIRRLATALNVASDPRSSVRIEWTEPDAAHASRTLAGPVPVTQRSLALNLQGLEPGQYLLEVTIERKGTLAVSSRRAFAILP